MDKSTRTDDNTYTLIWSWSAHQTTTAFRILALCITNPVVVNSSGW